MNTYDGYGSPYSSYGHGVYDVDDCNNYDADDVYNIHDVLESISFL